MKSPASLLTVCAALALPALPAPAPAATPTVEERLQALEAGYAALKEENARLREQLAGRQAQPVLPAPSAPPATAVVTTDDSAKIKLGGFIQGQYEAGDAGDQRFAGIDDRVYFRRARLAATGRFAEHFDFRIEADFGANSSAASTGLRASANEIYINWNRYPAANIRVGYLKPAFGGDQLWSDTTTLTIERPLASDRIADGRQPGIGAYGSFLGKRLGYIVTAGHGNGSGSSQNDDDRFLGAVRIFGTLFDSAKAGRLIGAVNTLHSEDASVAKPGFGFDSIAGGTTDGLFRGRRRGWGADAHWTRGPASIGGEWLRERFEPDNALPARTLDAQGWQLTAAYMVVPQRLQAVLRREVFDPDVDTAGDATENWVAGFNYLIKGDDIKLMINYLFGDAPGLAGDSGRLLARMQIAF
jgi:hypothetical protein